MHVVIFIPFVDVDRVSGTHKILNILQRLSVTPQRHFFLNSEVKLRWTSIKCFHDEFNCRRENRTIVMETFDCRPPKFYFRNIKKIAFEGACD